VKKLAEFCECGSLIIDGRCTNKSCTIKVNVSRQPAEKTSGVKKTSKKSTDAPKPAKKPNPRRASKCITYNLYDKRDDQAGE